MCRSVPQIVVLVILTIASVGAVMSGFGTIFQGLLSRTLINERFHRCRWGTG